MVEEHTAKRPIDANELDASDTKVDELAIKKPKLDTKVETSESVVEGTPSKNNDTDVKDLDDTKSADKVEPTRNLGDDLKTRIAKQIEYYFSDVNLIKDKFMQEELKKNDNCVKISTLLTFSRLAKLTKTEDVIVAALKDSDSDLIEVDESAKKIRRKKPLPDKEEYEKQLLLRTLHISGFSDSLQFDDLHRFCSKFGEVESLSMRQHYKTKQFKGCIHVTFKDSDIAKKVHEGEQLKFKDRELRTESMPQYSRRKEEMKAKRVQSYKAKKGDLLQPKQVQNE